MKHLKRYNESAITNVLVDTFCDLPDDFPVTVKVGPLHNRIVIKTNGPGNANHQFRHGYTPINTDSFADRDNLEWLRNMLEVIASKINYLSEDL